MKKTFKIFYWIALVILAVTIFALVHEKCRPSGNVFDEYRSVLDSVRRGGAADRVAIEYITNWIKTSHNKDFNEIYKYYRENKKKVSEIVLSELSPVRKLDFVIYGLPEVFFCYLRILFEDFPSESLNNTYQEYLEKEAEKRYLRILKKEKRRQNLFAIKAFAIIFVFGALLYCVLLLASPKIKDIHQKLNFPQKIAIGIATPIITILLAFFSLTSFLDLSEKGVLREYLLWSIISIFILIFEVKLFGDDESKGQKYKNERYL